ncbi:hypothetical protein KFK09_019812 [Dendrobium nobile]|uniref:Uncharacterized protein n=1 Tax=Dendrobium nobile TaxID=94219 RepID=A0A8T3AS97_DENNO|nr:hypothetical protein KFK09_019812 [Dendrobium nobile]
MSATKIEFLFLGWGNLCTRPWIVSFPQIWRYFSNWVLPDLIKGRDLRILLDFPDQTTLGLIAPRSGGDVIGRVIGLAEVKGTAANWVVAPPWRKRTAKSSEIERRRRRSDSAFLMTASNSLPR